MLTLESCNVGQIFDSLLFFPLRSSCIQSRNNPGLLKRCLNPCLALTTPTRKRILSGPGRPASTVPRLRPTRGLLKDLPQRNRGAAAARPVLLHRVGRKLKRPNKPWKDTVDRPTFLSTQESTLVFHTTPTVLPGLLWSLKLLSRTVLHGEYLVGRLASIALFSRYVRPVIHFISSNQLTSD